MKLWTTFLNRKNKTQAPAQVQTPEKYILCIDGGGMRGIIPVVILQKLEELIRQAGGQKNFASYFDLIAGTSTGGLIALAITCPTTLTQEKVSDGWQTSLKEIEKIYLTKGEEIFTRNRGDFLGLSQVATNKYSKDGIEKLLYEWFDQSLMKESVTPVMVSTYDLSRGSHFGISSMDTPDFPVRIAARATSAAPTYFAPVKTDNALLVDGGVISNNPSLYAYAKAKEMFPTCPKFHIISISTGAVSHTMEEHETSGLLNWIDKVVPMYSTAQKSTCDFVVSALSDVDYLRIDREMNTNIKMDETNPYILNSLKTFGESVAKEYEDRLKVLANELVVCNR